MKIKNLFYSVLLILNLEGCTQTVTSPYEVAVWYGFTEAAICYTFDDGCSNQFKIAIPLFDEYDFKLTLFTVTNWPSADVTQNNTAVSKRIVLVDDMVYIYFNVVPDAGDVIIIRNSKPEIPEVNVIPNVEDNKTSNYEPVHLNSSDDIIRAFFIERDQNLFLSELLNPGPFIHLSDVAGSKLLNKKYYYSYESVLSPNLSNKNIKS